VQAQIYANNLLAKYQDPTTSYKFTVKGVTPVLKKYLSVTYPKYNLNLSDCEVVGWTYAWPAQRYEVTAAYNPSNLSSVIGRLENDVKDLQTPATSAITTYETDAETLTFTESKLITQEVVSQFTLGSLGTLGAAGSTVGRADATVTDVT
jgi:hypothetical protein